VGYLRDHTIIVAVAVFRPSAVVFPPQQSPMFGQRASSQTVCKFRPRRSFLILLKEAPDGIEVFRKEGNRGLTMSSETFGYMYILNLPLCIAQDHAFRRLPGNKVMEAGSIV
jgi:hypothetical protein